MKTHKIAPEVKEQIINRIKNDGVTVAQASKDHGVSEVSIYSWIAKKWKVNQLSLRTSNSDERSISSTN